MIGVIQTEYNGLHFRSRLEARWAVFFDSCGVAYQYEPEGYNLGQLGFYLPDFYLPELNLIVEVKPEEMITKAVEDKLAMACYIAGTRGTILGGIPKQRKSALGIKYVAPGGDFWHLYDTCEMGAGKMDNYYAWCVCPDCGKVGFEFEGRSDRLKCKRGKCKKHSANGDRMHTYDDSFLLEAYSRARRARFEHGEKP
jgi:hypothetical protein